MTSSAPAGLPGLLTTVVSWVPRLFVLSVTWLVQVLAGAVVLGFAPATAVLADGVARRLADPDAPADLRGGWRTWRAELWSAQLPLGLPALQVVLLAFYLQLTRGSVLAVSVAVLGAVYVVWLAHLPAVYVRRHDGVGAPALWLANLRLMAGGAGAYLLSGVVLLAGGWALVWYAPVAAVAFGPAAAALVAALAVRRVVGRAR
ncbi:protein of unknown function DUF624 [Beutenbergia cavernae DSM 12333]|uniref:Uncharacterized protein n=1 Tax=Beutenbergia cavernae (strain ATCC BAA-8 / DSM 12333 / CCUG 43141 / JCM 11478 / NBRC 16432 / NCIMB 13614 / HKI 0122) TaxID=471853 RepID=C5C539_BEUC1|nr:DUF624 domain-containing protein [Beutenbergia cavernae]ACQ82179.1 protein of unknown function DUF624 [Beutenbergia cavernae DSM 12333]